MRREAKRRCARLIHSLSCLATTILAASAQAITIPTVPVGNPGNLNDPVTGSQWGMVEYEYRMGMYEVTVGQYTAFLNAVAATDTYSLYNTHMATDLQIAGIARSGVSGSYSYSVIGSANHPVTYVSWGDAARFANWLHNGQPTGAEGPGTTETGAYTLNGFSNLATVSRNSGAEWFIPTQSEWYKAAYHQPTEQGGDADDYWEYPMRTNGVPYSDQLPGATPDDTRVGNFFANDGLANGYNDGYAATGLLSLSGNQNYLTDVGAYALSSSYYGTFDQGGNVWEWDEESISGLLRGVLGGAWTTDSKWLAPSLVQPSGTPNGELKDIGFRVATVPEPSTAVLAIVGGVLLRWLRRHPK